jgi:GNAT superfamily N-acetyltransferase
MRLLCCADPMHDSLTNMDVEVTAEPEQMPAPSEVEALLAAASARLGPSDAAALAQASARMYSWARAIPGAATASVHDDDRLVGFGYGYSWDWTSMSDAWSVRLADRLGAAAAALNNSFSVVLLVVAPDARRQHLGARLLMALDQQADEPVTWLQTAADSPTRALCESAGWLVLDDRADPVIMLRSQRADEAPVPRHR